MTWLETAAGKQWKREYQKRYMPHYCKGSEWKKKKQIYNQRYRDRKKEVTNENPVPR